MCAMIREARAGDAPELARLITELGYPTSSAEMASRLEWILLSPDRATYVSEADGTLNGMIGLMLHGYYERDAIGLQVAALVVTEQARGRGIGRELLLAGERWGAERGCDIAWLTSGLQRADAHHFYRSAGYSDTGLRFVKELPPDASPPPPDGWGRHAGC